MKKLVVLMIVLMFVGAYVFADAANVTAGSGAAVTVAGAVEAGAKIVNSGSTTTIQQFTNNEGTTGWANLNLGASIGDMSANFYLRSTDFTTWTIPNAWVTEKLLKDMIELRAGNMDNAATSTANKGWGGVNGVGIQVLVLPISGLTIGANIPAPLTAVAIDDKAAGLAKTFKVGAAYAMPNLVTVDLTYQAAGEFDAGVNVTAVPGLTAQVEAQILTAKGATNTIFENVTYALGALTVGANATEALATATTITIVPTVSYTISPTLNVYGQIGYTTPGNTIAPEVGVGLPFNAMGTLKIQYDGSFAKTSSNTININFIHNF